MNFTFDTEFEHSDEVLFRELKGESVLLDLKGEYYYGLDSVGTRVWQLLGEHGRLSGVLDAMMDEYDVSEDRLRDDLTRIASELLEKGLLLVKTPKESEESKEEA